MNVKVVSVGETVAVTGGIKKQDVVIADVTDTCYLTLWEEKVNTLIGSRSYALKNVMVRRYGDVTYLSSCELKDDKESVFEL